MAEEKIIGIDLGTTNSVVAVMEGGEVKVIPNQEGHRLTPSVVAFTDKGDRLVGDPAKRQAVTNSRRTIYSIKRFMGRRHSEVQAEEKIVPYKVVGGPNELVKVDIDGKTVHAARNLRADPAQAQGGGGELSRATPCARRSSPSRPTSTTPSGRRPSTPPRSPGSRPNGKSRTRKTGKKTKQRMRIINEPTAASLAYGLDKKKNEKIAVFDLGGGTFDISILDVGDGVFEVKATNGDTHLGGDDFDQVLIDYVAEEFKKQHGIDLRKDPMALQRLKEACEQAKKDLSQQTTTDINLPFITADASGPKHLQFTIARSKFEQLVDHLIERCRGPVLTALKDAGYKPSDIDEVVLVGGMTRMPRVQQLVKEIFGKEGHKGVNPDEVVAIGAAIQGAQLLLGSKSRSAAARRHAAVAGHRDPGRRDDQADRTQHDHSDRRRSEIFSTAEDNQPAVTVQVFQGERPMASDNRLLGRFNLEDIHAGPARRAARSR